MIKIDWQRKPLVGSFGAVYRARDVNANRTLAVKVLTRTDDESVAAFRREYRIMRSLGTLPSVPQVFSCSIVYAPQHPEIDGRWAIFMEYLRGKTLMQVIQKHKMLTDASATRLARKLLNAVGSLHGQDVLHRDLHAGNIFLCTSGEVKLLDFGEACSAWLASSGGEGLYLANGYEPPEAALGDQWSPASDIYMVAKSVVHARYGALLSPAELPATRLGVWASACTQDDPKLRPQTCAAAAAFLPTRLDLRLTP